MNNTLLKILKCIISLFCLSSCITGPVQGENLSKIGFYSSPEEIIDKLKNSDPGFREHFMLGVSYKKIGKKKNAIFHFANSCFKYSTKTSLKLYPYPVYKFVDGFHIKSVFFDDSVYEIADLFYEYREYEYVVKFIDLIDESNTALYRDAVILKSKALHELKHYSNAVSVLRDILPKYEDIDSISNIHIRIASIFEEEKRFVNAKNEYFEVMSLDNKTWQAGIAAKRILNLKRESLSKLTNKEILQLSETLYHNSRYKDSLNLLNELAEDKTYFDDSQILYTIRSGLRCRELEKTVRLIEAYKNDPNIYYRLLKTMADELWDMRRKSESVKIYKRLIGSDDETLSKEALKRVAIYLEDKNTANSENYLLQYIKQYPKDKTSDYFLWLIAKKNIRSKKLKEAAIYLEHAVSGFPNSIYSGRNRFWLYKIYSQSGRGQDTEKILLDLLIKNPDSAYTWTLIDRLKKSYSIEELRVGFHRAVESKKLKFSLFYHTLLFALDHDLNERNTRIEDLEYSEEVKKYKQFEKDLDEFDLDSRYKKLLKGIEKYFSIGYLKGVNREIDIIPDDTNLQREKYIALSNYGERYASYYLALVATSKLLKSYNLKENISLLSNRINRRLFPYAYEMDIYKICNSQKCRREEVLAVMKAESSFNHAALSPAGAIGLMQLMPATAKDIARGLKIKDYELKNPSTSILFGVKYLSWLERYFKNDFTSMIAAYNAGATNVKRWKKKNNENDNDYFVEFIPFNETRYYVLRTRKYLIQYRLINESEK